MPKKRTVLGLEAGKLLFFILSAPVLLLCGLLSRQAGYEIMISLLSVLTVLYVAQGNRAGCALGAAYAASFGAVCLTRQLVGLAAFNLLCGLPSYLTGFFLWKKHQTPAGVQAKKMSCAKLAVLLTAAGVCFAGFFMILKAAGSSNPLFDGLTFTTGLAGMALLTLRYMEQWYFNMAANFFALILWIIKTTESVKNFNFLIICSIAVAVNLMGLISWRKIYKAGAA